MFVMGWSEENEGGEEFCLKMTKQSHRHVVFLRWKFYYMSSIVRQTIVMLHSRLVTTAYSMKGHFDYNIQLVKTCKANDDQHVVNHVLVC